MVRAAAPRLLLLPLLCAGVCSAFKWGRTESPGMENLERVAALAKVSVRAGSAAAEATSQASLVAAGGAPQRQLRSGKLPTSLAALVAQRRAQDGTGEHCSIVTGGECFIFGCDKTRGGKGLVDCTEGYCLCRVGYCNLAGKCIVDPDAGGDPSDMWKKVETRIRWATHPENCFNTADGYARMQPCSATPMQFIMPVGPVGIMKNKGDKTQCLGILSPVAAPLTVPNVIGAYLGQLPCDVADDRQNFVMPKGGTGLIRWRKYPDKCLKVSPALPGLFASSILLGTPIVTALCDELDLGTQFGVAEEPPPPAIACTNPAGCQMVKEMSLDAFCLGTPLAPQCRRLKQCPPGGCRNGVCKNGACVCNLGFQGPMCDIPVPGPIPIDSFGAPGPAPSQASVIYLGPAPAPAPAGAPVAGAVASPGAAPPR